MEAYVVEEPGGNFRQTDLPIPVVRPDQVLVRIQASGVNPLDTKIRAGKASLAKQPLPTVLGVDMAGIVEEVGARVSAFRRGDEVYGLVGGLGGLQGTTGGVHRCRSRLAGTFNRKGRVVKKGDLKVQTETSCEICGSAPCRCSEGDVIQ